MAKTREPPPWLKVCTTCDRYAPVQELIGAKLADALEKASAPMTRAGHIVFRRVPCLSGCKHPGNIALGASSKVKIRLNRLRPEDAQDVMKLALQFTSSPTGEVPEAEWPESLRGHLATIIPPQSIT